jgi:uncharacterized protein YneF (UPF0154 family)
MTLATKTMTKKTAAKKQTSEKAGTKSDVIREILAAQPKAGVKDVRAILDERGVRASDALINKIKYGRKPSGRKSLRGGKKSNSHTSKADAIRGMFGEMGAETRSRDVIAALAKRGVAVSSAQVSTMRGQLNHPRTGALAHVHAASYDHLLAAKKLVALLGGIAPAQRALADLAKLLES